MYQSALLGLMVDEWLFNEERFELLLMEDAGMD